MSTTVLHTIKIACDVVVGADSFLNKNVEKVSSVWFGRPAKFKRSREKMILIYEVLTRVLDIVISVCAILLLSPILMIIAILLRLSGEGEVFYKQERIGRNGRTFKLIKFATMLKNSMSMGNGAITVRNDQGCFHWEEYCVKLK